MPSNLLIYDSSSNDRVDRKCAITYSNVISAKLVDMSNYFKQEDVIEIYFYTWDIIRN